MPSREQTVRDAIRIFEHADSPFGLTAVTAWLGIYQTLLWYEPVNWVGLTQLPPIIVVSRSTILFRGCGRLSGASIRHIGSKRLHEKAATKGS